MKRRAHAFCLSTIAVLLGCSVIYDTTSLTSGATSEDSGGERGGGGSGQSAAGGMDPPPPRGGSGGNSMTGGGSTGNGTGGSDDPSGGSPAEGGGAGTPPVTVPSGAGGGPEPDCSATWYPDNDGDGYAADDAAGVDCEIPGYVQATGDCDDDNYYNSPGLTELCDGIDNDCDSATTDVCPLNCLWDDDYEGHLYLFCWWPTQTRAAAGAICAEQLMRLARMDDEAEQSYVLTWHDPDNSWIGGSDSGHEGNWKWEDGETFWLNGTALQPWEDWASGEPSNSSGAEHCMLLNGSGNWWNDHNCDNPHPFTCERY